MSDSDSIFDVDNAGAFRQVLTNILRDVFRLGMRADEIANVLEDCAKTIRSHIAITAARRDNPDLVNLLRRKHRLSAVQER